MRNPFAEFSSTERRNVIIYMLGIMMYKFGLEAFTGSITLLALDRFDPKTNQTNLAILQAINQAFQCVGSIAIAPLIKRFPTRSVLASSIFLFGILSATIIIVDVATGGKIPEGGKKRYGSWDPVILFPIYSVIGICHGMVELIRRVIPRDIVGGDVIKLKRMDAIVHVFYEVAGTSGAFFATFLVLNLGSALAPSITPFLFVGAAIAWRFIGLLDADRQNRETLAHLDQAPLLSQIGHGFLHFAQSLFYGAKIVFSSRKFIWLIPGYSIPLFTHRYLESQLSPAFAKSILGQGAYSQIMVGGSNFGELLGALFFAWILAAIWVPVSFGWAAGDVSLAAYIQSAVAKKERPGDKLSALGAVMAFLYVFYIVLYAVLSSVLGKVIDAYKNRGEMRQVFVYVGGVMYTVVAVVLILATLIPKGSWALNPTIIDDTEITDDDEAGSSELDAYGGDIKEVKEVKA
ncbi:hypothetical protein BGZ73_005486 [Actinomortierella ambigua]|nr:hypothetical protein BGZ73_005486 [Actinomortierella ambigua]